jgi:hypothetical protein
MTTAVEAGDRPHEANRDRHLGGPDPRAPLITVA